MRSAHLTTPERGRRQEDGQLRYTTTRVVSCGGNQHWQQPSHIRCTGNRNSARQTARQSLAGKGSRKCQSDLYGNNAPRRLVAHHQSTSATQTPDEVKGDAIGCNSPATCSRDALEQDNTHTQIADQVRSGSESVMLVNVYALAPLLSARALQMASRGACPLLRRELQCPSGGNSLLTRRYAQRDGPGRARDQNRWCDNG